MGQIDLRCGDAVNLFKSLENDSVDLIVADPPYNLGKDYGNNHDLKGVDEYIDFTKRWLTEAKRVLKPNGTIYVFMGVRFISYLYDVMRSLHE
jgi:site-specific DNA-methyltransferase (adenine-specific)